MGSTRNKYFLSLKCFGLRLFFLTIPKPLKQYTLFKKDDSFRNFRHVIGYMDSVDN